MKILDGEFTNQRDGMWFVRAQSTGWEISAACLVGESPKGLRTIMVVDNSLLAITPTRAFMWFVRAQTSGWLWFVRTQTTGRVNRQKVFRTIMVVVSSLLDDNTNKG